MHRRATGDRNRRVTTAESSMMAWLGSGGGDRGGRHAGVLLPGWQGSLIPADPCLANAPTMPEPFDRLLQPMLEGALMELKRKVPPTVLGCRGAAIPVEHLLPILRSRLTGLIIVPLGLACEEGSGRVDLAGGVAASVWRDSLARFPLLTPLLAVATKGWIQSTEAFLRRLDRDGARIAEWLGCSSLPPICGLAGTGADPHDGGNTVLLITFASGQQLYYKPRAITGEFLWQALLRELAASAPDCSLPAARVLPGSLTTSVSDRSGVAGLGDLAAGYGWMEAFATHAAPAGDGYWQGAGALLCLAQHCALTDLHAENVVRQETGPAVVDAECLGSGAVAGSGIFAEEVLENGRGCGVPGGEADAVRGMVEQMLATGLLGSSRLRADGLSDVSGPDVSGLDVSGLDVSGLDVSGLDVSGLFGRAAPLPSLLLPYWRPAAGGRLQLGLTPAYLPLQSRRPAPTSAIAVLPRLREGYRAAARALLASRSRLMAKGGWLDTLERVHAPRVLVRTTLEYALVLSRSLLPEYLQSSTDRRAALHTLLEAYPHLLGKGRLPAAIAEAEVEALAGLDLPRFALRLGASPDTPMTLEPGGIPFPGAGRATPASTAMPKSTVRRRLEALSEESLEVNCLPALSVACLIARS
jgi:hypothetical protein